MKNHLSTVYDQEISQNLVISEYFYPSSGATAQLVKDLADSLHEEGIPVLVITSTSSTTDNQPYPVIRSSSKLRESPSVVSKILKGSYFFVFALSQLFSLRHQIKSILIFSNPPFIGLLGLISKHIFGVKFYFVFQDLFPRSACLSGIFPYKGPIVSAWRYLLRQVVNSAEATILLSDDMKHQFVREFGSLANVRVIHNWSLHEPVLTYAPGSSSIQPLRVQYSGNFGRLHDMLTLLESSRQLPADLVSFSFVGGGSKRHQIEAYKERFCLTNVEIYDYVPRSNLKTSILSCDLSVVSLIPGAENTVAPSKIYGLLSCAKPVLLISPLGSELARIVITNNLGFVIQPGDVAGLTDVILSCAMNRIQLEKMGCNALSYYNKYLGKEKSLRAYIETLS